MSVAITSTLTDTEAMVVIARILEVQRQPILVATIHRRAEENRTPIGERRIALLVARLCVIGRARVDSTHPDGRSRIALVPTT